MAEAVDDFERWYRNLHPRMISSVVAITGSVDVAVEATDEAFARALERWEKVEAMESPSNWVYKVAVNRARRLFRRRAIEQRLVPHPVESVPGPAGELWYLVEALPLRQRTAVVLRHVGQLTEPEIGKVMGIARGTVSATLRQAHANLNAELTADESAIERKADVQP